MSLLWANDKHGCDMYRHFDRLFDVQHFQHSDTAHTFMGWLDLLSAVCCQACNRKKLHIHVSSPRRQLSLVLELVPGCGANLVLSHLGKQSETKHSQKACSKTCGKIKVTCCSQGEGLTVTSACDLGEACHLGLYLLHAVRAQGAAFLQQSTTVKLLRVFYAPTGD